MKSDPRHGTSSPYGRRPAISSWACSLAAIGLLTAAARAAPPRAGVAALEELRAFRQLGTVLFIAAHPDDENTQLITYLARGRRYRTAYLSVTRGDGGQNLLGSEFGELLGVIRTQELLAARRIDGGQQFFTRAIDFGFSKSDRETLAIWDHQAVLGDVVRVMRSFRPDVVITRFSPRPSGTHGHHTASAVLGVEAFKLAGDPNAFPEQLATLEVWQPKRILENGGGRWRGGGDDDDADSIRMDVDGEDPVRGESFAEIAGQSRAMHKSQGFGNFGGFRGGGSGRRSDSFELLAGEPATDDIFDGIDVTWNRIEGGAEIGQLADAAIAKFNVDDPAASVPALLEIRKRLASLPAEPLVREKQRQLDRILQTCLGITVETLIPNADIVPGETVAMHHVVSCEAAPVPVRWVVIRYPTTGAEVAIGSELKPDGGVEKDEVQILPGDAPLSQPYWLREPAAVGIYQVADSELIGTPENAPAFNCEYVFEIGGQRVVVTDAPMQRVGDGRGETGRRRLEVIAPATVTFASAVGIFHPGAASRVDVDVEAFQAGVAGTVSLKAPADWSISPAMQEVQLANVGDRKRLSFTVTAPPHAAETDVAATVEVNGRTYDRSRIEIAYEHIPRQLLQPRARLRAVSLDLAIRGRRVGYIAGAGDSVAECLAQMGYEVAPLTGDDLTAEKLPEFDAVVVGIRALNVRKDLAEHMPALFAFAESGGNVIVQYNRPDGMQVRELAPYQLRISGGRVTDENAAMRLLAPEHPALNVPNKITDRDFAGWVQERGLYYPDEWDEHFIPLLEASDPGERPLAGGILVAQHGKGNFVYTPLAWFRQLPAGVPGAYRLFANLVSLGK